MLLMLAGNYTEAAAALEIPDAELFELLHALPLKDSVIAVRLGITPQQVSNLRRCARDRIMRRL